MRLYRVLDEQLQPTYALEADDGTFKRIEGDILDDYTITDVVVEPRKILPPIEPPTIFAVAGNYRSHIEEVHAKIPEAPNFFAKSITSVVGPEEPIRLPAVAPDNVDYEVELAVIIGQTCRDVPADRAYDVILGYTVANDVSARDWQKRLGQWVRPKSFDTFCPLGPCIVTDIDPSNLRLRAILNGQVMQDASTSEMLFSIPQLIEFISADLTLLAGTVILTGTPAGVGEARSPKVYLKPGDVIVCSIEQIGELKNPVK